MFVEWKDKAKAEYCKTIMNGWDLDKNHTFTVLLFDEMRRIAEPPQDWVEPQPTPYVDVVSI